MDGVYLSGKVGISIKANTMKTRGMGMARCTGLMEVYIKESGCMEYRMA